MDIDSIILTIWFGVFILVGFATMAAAIATVFNRDPDKNWWPVLLGIALWVAVGWAYVAAGGAISFGDAGCWGQCRG